jgi:hypothetical protein
MRCFKVPGKASCAEVYFQNLGIPSGHSFLLFRAALPTRRLPCSRVTRGGSLPGHSFRAALPTRRLPCRRVTPRELPCSTVTPRELPGDRVTRSGEAWAPGRSPPNTALSTPKSPLRGHLPSTSFQGLAPGHWFPVRCNGPRTAWLPCSRVTLREKIASHVPRGFRKRHKLNYRVTALGSWLFGKL